MSCACASCKLLNLLAMDRSMMGLGKATLSDPLAKVRLVVVAGPARRTSPRP